ncbi:MAG: GNAT family N-acetyltransferase [Sphingomonadaceae bacterium]|nr:GNAT family N-acetyltransferase [Sphingomonadaceae bacterium]
MNIRLAADADRMEIARLHTESWRDAYRAILPAALLDETLAPIMAERWADQPIGPSDAVLVAEEGGALSGFAASWDGDPVYIDNLHVAAAARSRGIGRRLLAGTARHFLAIGRRKALLHVVASNSRARALYLALGGRPDGIEDKNLYGTVVPNERIEWDDLGLLLERATA